MNLGWLGAIAKYFGFGAADSFVAHGWHAGISGGGPSRIAGGNVEPSHPDAVGKNPLDQATDDPDDDYPRSRDPHSWGGFSF